MAKVIIFLSVIAIYCYLFQILHNNINKLVVMNLRFNYLKFGISLIILLVSYLFVPKVWLIILHEFQVKLKYGTVFFLQYASHLGKYIPGKLWAQLAQVILAKKRGVPPQVTLLSNVILFIVMSLVSIYVFLLSFLLWDLFSIWWRLAIVICVVLITCLLIRMKSIDRIVNFVLEKILKKDSNITIRYAKLKELFALLFSSWAIFAVGYFLLINSFYVVNIKETIIIVGIYSISWLVGYCLLLFPGGIGVREGAQVFLLNMFFPTPISVLIAISSRVWLTIGEMIISIIAFLLIKKESEVGTKTSSAKEG